MLGVGLFLSYTRPPFVLYGTLWILLIAFVTIALPAAYQQLQSAFRAVHPDLEDASRILGATRLRALGQITAPLLRTSVIATWCFIFVGVIRELSAAIILFTSETKVISVLIFDLNECGDLGAIAVLGIIMLVITFAVVIARQPHARLRRCAPQRRGTRYIVSDAVSSRNRRRRTSGRTHCRHSTPQAAGGDAARNASDLADRRGRPLHHGAQRGLRHRRARGCDDDGPCTAIGHARTLSAAGAALVNGTAAHGEDFDDTFEGGPVHAGAVIVPAVLAACERHGSGRPTALARHGGRHRDDVPARPGGAEDGAQGRLPPDRGVRRHGRCGGVGAALRLNARQMVDAFGIAGCMASGIIEYLAEGTWTKRMHAGWAAQSGLRAALLARAGFSGPRTVFEGVHGFFHGFANTLPGHYNALIGDFGSRWVTRDAGVQALSVRDHDASLHRLRAAARARDSRPTTWWRWSAMSARARCTACGSRSPPSRRRPTAMPANSRTPYCIADGFVRGNVGLDDFTDAAVRTRRCVALAAKVRYVIDPDNPYPNNFTGHIRATLRGGSVVEERQPHMRGGAHEPLSREDIEDKFLLNARHGG